MESKIPYRSSAYVTYLSGLGDDVDSPFDSNLVSGVMSSLLAFGLQIVQ